MISSSFLVLLMSFFSAVSCPFDIVFRLCLLLSNMFISISALMKSGFLPILILYTSFFRGNIVFSVFVVCLLSAKITGPRNLYLVLVVKPQADIREN